MYLFLITLGFNIDDIVSFMTSPVASFINDISEENIFGTINISVKEAIKLAEGDYSLLFKKCLSQYTLGALAQYEDVVEALVAGRLVTQDGKLITNPFAPIGNSLKAYEEFESLVRLINDVKSKQNYELTESNKADVKEFLNILEGADEFSNLGKALGVNLGLPVSLVDLLKFISFMLSIMENRANALSVTATSLDVYRFLTDENYRKEIKEEYNKLKKCINVFDVIDSIPHIKEIYTLLAAIIDCNNCVSIKTRAFNYVYDECKKRKYNIDEDTSRRILSSINKLFILKFVKTWHIAIPYAAGTNLFDNNLILNPAKDNGDLTFSSLKDIASFKYIFENVIIPNLKQGKYFDKKSDGTYKEKFDATLLSNPFLKDLITAYEGDVPLYKCNLDMMAVDKHPLSKIKFTKYIQGLKSLSNIKINGVKVSDLFVLYNLIVNLNRYGSDKLTKAFEYMIHNNSSLHLLNDYFRFLGNLDYFGVVNPTEEERVKLAENSVLDIFVDTILRDSAKIVTTDIGQLAPVILLNTDNGPQLMRKTGYSYTPWNSYITKIDGESLNEYLERVSNAKKYFCLGNPWQETNETYITKLKEGSEENILHILQELIWEASITILKTNCK